MVKNEWDLADLRVLCAVARRSSLSGAAVDLGISVAYVAKRLARLEKALAVPLFLRTTRRVSITAQGESVYKWARKVLEAAEDLDQEVAQARNALSGSFKVSTSRGLGIKHVAPILALLRKEHPGLEIWLELVDRRVDLIAEGFDMDIRVGEVHEPHLVAHKVADSVRVLCASVDYLERMGRPQTPMDLRVHECFMFRDRDQPFSVLYLQGPEGAQSVQVAGGMGSNQSDAIMEWARQGLGIALLSQWDVAQMLKQGALERVLPQHSQPANVYAVTPVRSTYSGKLQHCLRFIQDRLSQGPYALDLS